MVYRGQFKQGVIVLEDATGLTEGARVTIQPDSVLSSDKGPTLAETLKEFIGKAEGLPPDAARNHDHYLYGAPKK